MNWDRGLKRITLILSIIGAFIGIVFAYFNTTYELIQSRNHLEYLRTIKFSKNEEQRLINEWQQKLKQEYLSNQIQNIQNELNMMLNRPKGANSKNGQPVDFPQKPKWLEEIEELEKSGSLPIETQKKLQKRNEELDKLRDMGWKTLNGDVMPLTVEEVWNYENQWVQSDIKNTERTVFENKSMIPIVTLLVGVFGFVVVWICYYLIKVFVLLTRPMLLWVVRGFRNDGHKK